ncbi:failed axon connection [Ditylenchus destructor]|nr:failed axon connection [Ditylenchus destructor]
MVVLVNDWEKDLVYLIQLPRAGCVPSLSSFALKLETWLRMADIQYQNVDNEFKYKSEKGQIPFVELNGRQIADTNIIIEELTRIFHIQMDDIVNNDAMASAHACAFHSLVEDTLRWHCWYFRALNNSFFGTEDGVAAHFRGFRKFIFKNFILRRMKSKLMSQCRAQGIGRLTPGEVDMFARKNLKALSTFLGDKKYMMGDNFCTLDATVFGHLSMFYFCPLNKGLKDYMEHSCRNLVDYLRNIKEEFWPDWSDATTKLSLATKRKKVQNANLETVA